MTASQIDRTILSIRDLTKHYPGFHLSVPCLHVEPGNIVALVGPNGAGKTTLIRAILGIVNADSGTISYRGKCVDPQSAKMRILIGYVPEEPVLYEGAKVDSLLEFVKCLYPCWDDTLCENLLQYFRIDRMKRIRSLSKGMRTKLLVILALCHKPEMLILDEPTSGMDVTSRDDFWQFIGELTSTKQINAILLSSHQLDDIERLCDRIVFIHNGALLFDESKQVIHSNWKKVTFTSTQAIPELPGSIIVNSDPNFADRTSVVTPWTDRLRLTLINSGVHDLTVEPLTLKEVYIAIVRRAASFHKNNCHLLESDQTRTE